MVKGKVISTYRVKVVNKEDFPEKTRRMALTEAFAYTVNLLTSVKDEKLSYCLVCGKWFVASVTYMRACSKRCRNYLNSILHRIRGGSIQHVSRRLRKTPLYLFLFIAIREGYLPPQVVGEEKPEDLPTPLLSPTDFVEAFGLTASEVGKELSEGVKEILKAKGEKGKEVLNR